MKNKQEYVINRIIIVQVREERSVAEVYEFINCCENDSNANIQI